MIKKQNLIFVAGVLFVSLNFSLAVGQKSARASSPLPNESVAVNKRFANNHSLNVEDEFPVLSRDRIAEARRWSSWGRMNLINEKYVEAEEMLTLSLRSLNDGYDQPPNFLIPRPAQSRQISFSIPGIFSYYERSYEPSEIIANYVTRGISLDDVYTDIVATISQGYEGLDLISLSSVFANNLYGELRRLLRQDVDPDELGDIRQQLIEQSNQGENAHEIAVNALRDLQKALILQEKEEKIGKALESAELIRNLEFTRLVPVAVYSTLGTEGSSVRTNYKRLFEEIGFSSLKLEDAKDIAARDKATLVYYSVISSNQIFVWVIQPTGEIKIRKILISEDKTLEQVVEKAFDGASSCTYKNERGRKLSIRVCRDFRAFVGVEAESAPVISQENQESHLQELYQLIIGPVEEFLPSNPEDNVIFIPQGILSAVPFAALQDSDGQYLIEKHTLRVAPSLSSLANAKKTMKSLPEGNDFLMVGNPVMPTVTFSDGSTQQLPDLQGAQNEAVDIAEIVKTSPLIQLSARKDVVARRMSGAKVIHFATHGVLSYPNQTDFIMVQQASDGRRRAFQIESEAQNSSSDQIRYSLWYGEKGDTEWSVVRSKLNLPGAIALNNSFLTAREILSLNLDADLVVLSACSTGVGIPTESTVLGLPFSLGLSGASRVLVSLWRVPDNSTRLLMTEFYGAMRRQSSSTGKIDQAAALREAMLKVKEFEPYQDPIHWAAFSLIDVPQGSL